MPFDKKDVFVFFIFFFYYEHFWTKSMLWWFYFRQVLYRNLFLFFYISLICKSVFHGADHLVIFTVFRGAFSSITDKNSLLNVSNCSSGSSKLLKIKSVSLTHPFHIFSCRSFWMVLSICILIYNVLLSHLWL